MFRSPLTLILLLLASLGLLMAACSPGANQLLVDGPHAPTADGEPKASTVSNSEALPAVPGAAGRPSLSVADASGQSLVDANGVPVGFTEDGRPYRGKLDAAVVIEEFSDFQCPFCGRFAAQTLPGLEKSQIETGNVLLIYYDFPLENIHPQAVAAANAARCAAEHGPVAYWQMHDLLFADIQSWSGTNAVEVFLAYGEEIGVDAQSFDRCVRQNEKEVAIREDIELALSRGVRSTPSFFLNGQMFVGAQPLAAFEEAIAAVQDGQDIAEPQVAQNPEPLLQPPSVAPTPAALDKSNIAFAKGDPSAPVTIVEFTDYQCPFCQQYAQTTLPRVFSELVESGQVYYIMKDLPLDSLHPQARIAAEAARCAGELGDYETYHDLLFDQQSAWGSAGAEVSAHLSRLAEEVGIEPAAFETCLDEERYASDVQANVDEAFSLNASATPYFFVDGMPISGAQPYELFEYAVELALSGELVAAYAPIEPDLSQAYSIGDPQAPLEIIEFTDYQCPFCARHFSETYPQIRAKYIESGLVHYVFKDFPLDNIHPQATTAALAARCAGDQDAYLEMHDLLFERQGEWNGRQDAAEIFAAYAQELGLDGPQFETCQAEQTHLLRVQADLQEGAQMGINGTPAFLLNGHFMSGAQPYALFEQAIEQLLDDAAQ